MAKDTTKGPKRPALGRGLSSLITTPAARDGTPGGRRILEVPIEQVAPHRDQPRQHFDETRLAELAASIRENGVLFPLLVRREQGGYAIIAGERRWRACQKAGLQSVPVLVEEADDDEAFELALIENIQREDLNPIEEAQAYERLLARHDWTQEALADHLGKDRTTVTNALRLLKLPQEVRAEVVEGRLSMGHARALVALGDEAAIRKAARQVRAEGLTVRATEALVRRLKRGDTKSPAAPPSAATRDLVARLQRRLGTKVRLSDRSGRGKLTLEYATLDELDRIVGTILGDERP